MIWKCKDGVISLYLFPRINMIGLIGVGQGNNAGERQKREMRTHMCWSLCMCTKEKNVIHTLRE